MTFTPGSLAEILFSKWGYQVLEGTLDAVTPQVSWLQGSTRRIALAVKAEDVGKVAKQGDMVRAVARKNEKEVVLLYSPQTKESLALRKITRDEEKPVNELSGCVMGAAMLFTLIPVWGVMVSWMTLLCFLIQVGISLRPGRNLVFVLVASVIYLVGAFVGFKFNFDLVPMVLVFILNLVLVGGVVQWIEGERKKACEELLAILRQA